ncbi:MAG: hypothetical protein FJ125_01215, partial [Deltaproteobacteria bacterium]|nr:hypothetical protein [Deltaproteobacteria bacterium]
FSYLPLPVVTALVPDHGPESGGITVEVRGTGFSAGITRIYIGSNLLRNARFDAGQGTITGQVPAGNGVVPVHAANLEVNGPALEQGFTYDPPPQPSAVQPSSGPASGGTRITVLGSGFQQGARVLVGGLESAEVQVLDGTTLHALVPAGEPGLADVTVVNPDGQRGRLPAAFSRVPAPVLLDVSPGRGCVLGGARVTLSGRHFQDQAEVRFGAAAAEVLERAGDRELQVVAPPGEGTVDVAVVNPDGQQDVLAGGFTYTATPQPTRVIPAHGPLAGGGEVLLEGSCFPAEAQVSFAGEPAEVTGRPSAEQLVVRVPPAAAEATVEVAVAPPGGELGLLELGYTYHDAVFEEEVPSRRSGALCGLAEDLDGDGAQDLLLAGDSAWIWRGGGQGLELSPTVAFSTGAGKTVLDVASVPLGLPAGPALVLAVEDLADEQGGGLALLSPVAARSWEALAAPRFLSHELVFSIGVGDLTGDGLPDLVAGEAGGNELFVQQAGRRFQPMEEWIGRQGSGVTLAVLIGNFTGDGSADLFLAVRGGDGNRLLEGTGGGGFIDRSNRLPLSETATLDALAMDIDGDGDLDLLLAEEQGRDRLWRNEVDEGGAQGFRDRTDELFPGVAEMTVSLFAADLDGDRRLDLLATQGPGAQRGHRIYRNAGGGRLEEVSAAWLPRGMRAPAMLGLVVAGPAGVPDLILTSVDAMLWLRDRIGE